MIASLKCGRFADIWRGNGVFASVSCRSGFFTVALRWRWHFYAVIPAGKPHVRRVYIGPLELEFQRAR